MNKENFTVIQEDLQNDLSSEKIANLSKEFGMMKMEINF